MGASGYLAAKSEREVYDHEIAMEREELRFMPEVEEQEIAVWTSFAVAMGSHFGVGAARSVLTGRGMLRSGMDMVLVGLGVAALGYFVGDVLVTHLFR